LFGALRFVLSLQRPALYVGRQAADGEAGWQAGRQAGWREGRQAMSVKMKIKTPQTKKDCTLARGVKERGVKETGVKQRLRVLNIQ
jgi:hypothetical protein